MARHDALDLNRACPLIAKQQPHLRLTLVTFAGIGELEPTEPACVKRLADNMYARSGFSVPGLQPLPATPSDWEQRNLEQVHEENVQEIVRLGSLQTVELSKGHPSVANVLSKQFLCRELGPRVHRQSSNTRRNRAADLRLHTG